VKIIEQVFAVIISQVWIYNLLNKLTNAKSLLLHYNYQGYIMCKSYSMSSHILSLK